jgi:hypothetical protein
MRMLWLLIVAGCNVPQFTPGPGSGDVYVRWEPGDWAAWAEFREIGPPASGLPGCLHKMGECAASTEDCRTTGLSPGRELSAGVITVGVNVSVKLMPTDTNDYASVTSPAGVKAGDIFKVSASGGSIAAFSGQVVLPAAVTFAPLPAIVPRDRDLQVTWSGGSAGAVLPLGLFVFNAGVGETDQIDCIFDPTTGSGVIPKELLQLLRAGGLGGWSGGEPENTAMAASNVVLHATTAAIRGSFPMDVTYQ